MMLIQQPWCNTCGVTMTIEEYEKSGDCESCAEWREEQSDNIRRLSKTIYEDSGVSSMDTGA